MMNRSLFAKCDRIPDYRDVIRRNPVMRDVDVRFHFMKNSWRFFQVTKCNGRRIIEPSNNPGEWFISRTYIAINGENEAFSRCLVTSSWGGRRLARIVGLSAHGRSLLRYPSFSGDVTQSSPQKVTTVWCCGQCYIQSTRMNNVYWWKWPAEHASFDGTWNG